MGEKGTKFDTHFLLEKKLPNGENSPQKTVIWAIIKNVKCTSWIYTFKKNSNFSNKQNWFKKKTLK